MDSEELVKKFRNQPPEVQEMGFSEWVRSNNYKVSIKIPIQNAIQGFERKAELMFENLKTPFYRMQKQMEEVAKNLQRLIDREKGKFDEKYQTYYPAMRRMLLERDYHVPDSSDEMFHVFFFEILNYEDFEGGLIRSLEREDFIKFHEVMEKKMQEKFPDILNEKPPKKIAGPDTQIGRPREIHDEEIYSWYNSLKKNKELQHNNGKPHKAKIKEEIRKKHKEKYGFKPSLSSIDKKFSSLRL